MNTLSFMTANYVARPLGYRMSRGWGEGDRATNEAFRPIETFGEQLDAILSDIRALGFTAVDLWEAHLNPAWATAEHIAVARRLLAQHGLAVVSLGGWFGATPEAFEAACRLAVALAEGQEEAPLLGGRSSMLQKDRSFVVATLQKYGLRLGVENHPESTPEALLAQIGDGGGGTLGVTVDTGWFATQGYDAARAIEELGEHIFHVHLKDVYAGPEHVTCPYGQGVVPLERCVRALQAMGYPGAISIEYEPEHEDPTAAVGRARAMVLGWLEPAGGRP